MKMLDALRQSVLASYLHMMFVKRVSWTTTLEEDVIDKGDHCEPSMLLLMKRKLLLAA